MIQAPQPQQLFDAIEKKSFSDVENYFIQGGSLQGVVSARGYAPLVEVSMQFGRLKSELQNEWEGEIEELDDMSQTTGPKDVSSDKRFEELLNIGALLLENGADYEARAGRSNRSIKLRDMMNSRFPEVHRQWDAVALKASMLNTVKQEVDLDSKSNPMVRKI